MTLTLGKLFALSDFEEQAQCLNEAGRTLRRCCDSDVYEDIQLCKVADKLDVDGKRLILRLAKFLDSDAGRR